MLQYGKHLKKILQTAAERDDRRGKAAVVKDQRKTTERISSLSTETHRSFYGGFYCPKAKLVIELDGGQHYSEVIRAKDESRDRYMERVGLEVLRFSDTEVLENLPGVLEEIWNRL